MSDLDAKLDAFAQYAATDGVVRHLLAKARAMIEEPKKVRRYIKLMNDHIAWRASWASREPITDGMTDEEFARHHDEADACVLNLMIAKITSDANAAIDACVDALKAKRAEIDAARRDRVNPGT